MQGPTDESALLLDELLRHSVRAALFEVMADEVEALCGPKHRPNHDSPCRRAGSERGVAYLKGGREEIRRPRVRHEEDGEVRLSSYEAVSKQSRLFEQIVAQVGEGMSSRSAAKLSGKSLSKSTISRAWIDKSREQLDLFRGRDLSACRWLAIHIDGVFLGDEKCVVVALGIDEEGNKQMLDFEEGPSENATVVGSLIERLVKRSFAPTEGRRLLVCRDGSAAIDKAVRAHWPDAVVQECLVHAQRNVRDKVRKRDKADVDRHFAALRSAEGKEAGEEAFEELHEWLSERNAAALALGERRDALLAVHRLGVPSTLNITFLSTNCIENAIRNWREATGNVKRWQEKGDMVSRWMASGLLWAEGGFHKVRHAQDLPHLAAALEHSAAASGSATPSPPASAPSSSAGEKKPCPPSQT